MIPLVGIGTELTHKSSSTPSPRRRWSPRAWSDRKPGTMIEIPRAALAADDRRRGRLLLLRHQRPDADGLRIPAMTRRSSCRSTWTRRFCGPDGTPSISAAGRLMEMGGARKVNPGIGLASAVSTAASRVGEVLPQAGPQPRELRAEAPARPAGGGSGGHRLHRPSRQVGATYPNPRCFGAAARRTLSTSAGPPNRPNLPRRGS